MHMWTSHFSFWRKHWKFSSFVPLCLLILLRISLLKRTMTFGRKNAQWPNGSVCPEEMSIYTSSLSSLQTRHQYARGNCIFGRFPDYTWQQIPGVLYPYLSGPKVHTHIAFSERKNSVRLSTKNELNTNSRKSQLCCGYALTCFSFSRCLVRNVSVRFWCGFQSLADLRPLTLSLWRPQTKNTQQGSHFAVCRSLIVFVAPAVEMAWNVISFQALVRHACIVTYRSAERSTCKYMQWNRTRAVISAFICVKLDKHNPPRIANYHKIIRACKAEHCPSTLHLVTIWRRRNKILSNEIIQTDHGHFLLGCAINGCDFLLA